MRLSFPPNIFCKALSNRHTHKKNKRSASHYSKHAQTGYPHASLQLFHQAVTLDVNPGGERQKKKGGRGLKWCNRAQRKTGGVLDWTGPGHKECPNPKTHPGSGSHPPPAHFPMGIHLGTHAGRWSGWVPSLNSPGALACQPSDLSQAGGGKPTTRIQNKHTLWTYWFFLFPDYLATKNNKREKGYCQTAWAVWGSLHSRTWQIFF